MKVNQIIKFVVGMSAVGFLSLQVGFAEEISIRLVKTDEARVDILAGDELFTSFHYGLGFHKPIFYPLKNAEGRSITRSYPIEFGVAGEAHDHWHHESLWLTYGDVNGIDFWAKKEAHRGSQESGKIVHRGFSRLESGSQGYLEATADWVTPEGTTILKQEMQAVFRANRQWREIDLTVDLTAQNEKVTFGDTKEGMFGIRVVPSLRENHSGSYINASGQKKEAGVWGKRSPWVALRGQVEGQDVTLAIFNHPHSTGFPTFWHARGYGLFAANPFGKKDFEKGAQPLNVMIHPGEKVLFRYRILIHSGKLSPRKLEMQFLDFSRMQE